MEAALWTLAVAAVTGLFLVAYRHPTAYASKWYPQLMQVPSTIVLMVSIVCFLMESKEAGVILDELADAETESSIRLPAKTLATLVFFLWKLWLAYIGYAVLLYFLKSLPRLLDLEEKKGSDSGS